MTPGLRAGIATAAGAAVAVAAFTAHPAVAAARRPGTTAATRPPAWRAVRVPSAVVSPAELIDVSATGPADAWAVGADAETFVQQGTPMILHWNGRACSKVALRGVPGPGGLSSVSAASRSNAWALGTDRSGNVLLHWNGRAWRSVAFPGLHTAVVTSVAAAPDGTAWLVGSSAGGAMLVERWNGAAWHVVATRLGKGILSQVRVSASGDVWAAGADASNNQLIAHEHRGAWTSLPVPGIPTVSDVLAVSACDVWAVGGDVTATPITASTAIGHWNGRRWTIVHLPEFDFVAGSISPGRSGKPQWAGLLVILPYRTEYLFYNGTTWSAVPGASEAPGSAFDVNVVTAHIPGTDATWAVGGYGNSNAVPVGRGIIEFNPG